MFPGSWMHYEGRPVGCGEQGGDLGFGEVGDDRAVEAFRWDRQDPLDDRGVVGAQQRGVPEQGVDGGQAGVAGPRVGKTGSVG